MENIHLQAVAVLPAFGQGNPGRSHVHIPVAFMALVPAVVCVALVATMPAMVFVALVRLAIRVLFVVRVSTVALVFLVSFVAHVPFVPSPTSIVRVPGPRALRPRLAASGPRLGGGRRCRCAPEGRPSAPTGGSPGPTAQGPAHRTRRALPPEPDYWLSATRDGVAVAQAPSESPSARRP